ncbi:MAG: glycosyltransferase [Candidatus Saccharimonadales bacterium]
MNSPKVTVLMPVYNGQRYLKQAIEGILNQTYKDFEFLIIDDGSTDKSKSIIRRYAKKDPRIRLISRPNKGLVATLNEGLDKASGEYIARMDCDDISLKKRLKIEVEYLDANPDVALVGSNYTIVDEHGKRLVDTNVFTHPDDLKLCLVTCNQYGHGSVMIRKSALNKVGNYDKGVGHLEDYDLWIRISHVAKVANIEEPLYQWRKTADSITGANLELQIQQTFARRDREFEYFLKNKKDYRIFSIHPSGYDYGRRKSVLYRDLAYLYQQKGMRWGAVKMLLLAIIFKPRVKRNYYYLIALLLRKSWLSKWQFEFQ